MGTVPAARRTGAAAYLLSQLLEEATTRGDAAMMLEVFEQNIPALVLYRRYGFTETARLLGWRRTAKVASLQNLSSNVEEISVIDASQMPDAFEYPNIPWQISHYAVLKAPGARAFRDDAVCVVIGETAVKRIRVHAFFAAERDWKVLRSVLAEVIQQFPNREFFAPAIFPEQFGLEIFEPLGFAREPLNQLLLRRDL
jgi:hypothetical protein